MTPVGNTKFSGDGEGKKELEKRSVILTRGSNISSPPASTICTGFFLAFLGGVRHRDRFTVDLEVGHQRLRYFLPKT